MVPDSCLDSWVRYVFKRFSWRLIAEYFIINPREKWVWEDEEECMAIS